MSTNVHDVTCPKVVIWWTADRCETKLTMYNVSVNRAFDRAQQWGYKRPTWYTPWRWITNRAGFITVGQSD